MLVLRCRARKIRPSSDDFLAAADAAAEGIQRDFTTESIADAAPIRVFRAALSRHGWNPNRYRISSEALLRRLVQAKGFPRINNVVDLNNDLSLKSLLPVGSYDPRGVTGRVCLRMAMAGETTDTLSKGALDMAGCMVIADDAGPFGSPINDSLRCMIRDDTTDFFMVFYAFTAIDVRAVMSEAEVMAPGCDVEILDARVL